MDNAIQFQNQKKELIFSEAAGDRQILTKAEVKICVKCHAEKHLVLLCLFNQLSIWPFVLDTFIIHLNKLSI